MPKTPFNAEVTVRVTVNDSCALYAAARSRCELARMSVAEIDDFIGPSAQSAKVEGCLIALMDPSMRDESIPGVDIDDTVSRMTHVSQPPEVRAAQAVAA